MTLWTGILRCGTCKAEINRAEHVPEEKKGRVAMASVFAGSCPNVRNHATFPDCNLNTSLEWSEEVEGAAAPAAGAKKESHDR